MGKLPAFQFYPGDWMKDPQVSMLTPLARGIWFDIICAMHEAGRTGEITGSYDQFSRISRCTIQEFSEFLQEISSTKVADVTFYNKNVTVINRRMKREYKEKEATRLRVKRLRNKKDGNDNVTSPSSYSSSDNINIKDVTEPVTPVVTPEIRPEQNGNWKCFPKEKFSLEPGENHDTKTFIQKMTGVFLSVARIEEFWVAFQINNFTGKKFYQSRGDCLQHFRNWLKSQELGDGKPTGSIPLSTVPSNLKRI